MIWLYCDKWGIVEWLNWHTTVVYPNNTIQDDYPIVFTIQTVCKSLAPIKVSILHVKGHQDQSKLKQPLTTPDTHNIDCNLCAATTIATPPIPHPDKHPSITTGMPCLQIKQQTVFRHLQQWLWDAATCVDYYQYLSDKFVWTQPPENMIQWQALHIARNWFNKNKLHFLNKFTHEWLPLQASHHVNSTSTDLLCPSCNQHHLETANHFLQCTQLDQHNLWEALQKDIKETCIKHNIPQPINDLLAAGLQAGRNNNSDILAYVQWQLPLQHTSQQQALLGWKQMYYECLASKSSHTSTGACAFAGVTRFVL